MKTVLYSILLLLWCSTDGYSQLKIHIKGGINTQDIKPGDLPILNANSTQEFTLNLNEAKFGYHFGLDFTIKIGNLLIMPEVLFSTSEVHYTFSETNDTTLINQVFKEHYNYLDIPFNIGMTFGPLAIFGGPVGHVYINSSSDLLQVENYAQTFENISYGWNVGTGVNLGRIGAQIKYEGNFSSFGDHLIFYGNNYTFTDKPSRLIASLVVGF